MRPPPGTKPPPVEMKDAFNLGYEKAMRDAMDILMGVTCTVPNKYTVIHQSLSAGMREMIRKLQEVVPK